LTSLELFVEKNCMRSHKTTLPGGKHRKSENRVEMSEYRQISPDFRRIYVILRFFDFWVFWRIILGCQCFDKSLNVRRIRKISINLDLNVWFRKSWHSCRAKNVLTNLSLFVEKFFLKFHKTTPACVKSRKSKMLHMIRKITRFWLRMCVLGFYDFWIVLIIFQGYKCFDKSRIVRREFFSEISQNTSCLCKNHEKSKSH